MPAGALEELRSQIEATAFNMEAPPERRAALLEDLQSHITDLAGLCAQYLLESEKYDKAVLATQEALIVEARENASWRDEVLNRALATPTELDGIGYASHDELDRLAEEGLLNEAAPLLVGRARTALSLEEERKQPDYVETLHPRDRTGKWRKKLGIKVDSTSVGGHFKVTGPDGELAIKPSKEAAEKEADKIANRYADAADKGLQDPGDTPYESLPSDVYSGDPKYIEQARKQILSGAPTTRDRYSVMKGGKRVYDESRHKLHDDIIEAFLRMGPDGKPGSGPRHRTPESGKPQVLFTGGGFASGKGGVVDGMKDIDGVEGGAEEMPGPHPWKPDDSIILDPDKIKAMLPEFGQMQKTGDPEANLRVYEEAWDISQAIMARIQKEKLNVVVDGVGNTSLDEVKKRVEGFEKAGYDTPRAVYVFTPTEVAIGNARRRMESAIKKGKLESIRYIPEDLARDVHGDVSKVFPDVLKWWPGDIEAYDTNTWTNGVPHPPKRLVVKHGGKDTIYDDEAKLDEYIKTKSKDSEPNAAESVGPGDVVA